MYTNSLRGICKVTILEIFRSRSTRPVKPPTAVWESDAKRTVCQRKPKMVSLWQGAGDTRMTCNSSWNTLDNHTLTAFIIFSYYYYLFLFVEMNFSKTTVVWTKNIQYWLSFHRHQVLASIFLVFISSLYYSAAGKHSDPSNAEDKVWHQSPKFLHYKMKLYKPNK